MDGHSAHSTAPGRSRGSQSPSHSASASVCSSVHKRKLASSDDHAPAFPFSYSDNRDGALTSNDDLESSARGADTGSEDESEEVVDDDEEDNDSMRAFTAARLENNANSRNPRLKSDSFSTKNDTSGLSEIGKEERGPAGSAPGPATGVGAMPGIVVKEDTVKGTFTENLQTSGAYSAREESLKREAHSKKRNHLRQEKMNDLVFVMYNSKLKQRQGTREANQRALISLDEIPSDDELITEKEDLVLPAKGDWLNVLDRVARRSL